MRKRPKVSDEDGRSNDEEDEDEVCPIEVGHGVGSNSSAGRVDAQHYPSYSMYHLVPWTEPRTSIQRLTFSMLLPTGVAGAQGTGGYTVQVAGQGWYVEVAIVWPKFSTDVFKILFNDLKEGMSDVHPKVIAFEKALKKLKGNGVASTGTGQISTTFRFRLPFRVMDKICGQTVVDGKCGTRMLMVELKK